MIEKRVTKVSGAYGVEFTGNDCSHGAFRHVHQLEGHCSLGGWCPGDGGCAPCAEVEALRGHIERIGRGCHFALLYKDNGSIQFN